MHVRVRYSFDIHLTTGLVVLPDRVTALQYVELSRQWRHLICCYSSLYFLHALIVLQHDIIVQLSTQLCADTRDHVVDFVHLSTSKPYLFLFTHFSSSPIHSCTFYYFSSFSFFLSPNPTESAANSPISYSHDSPAAKPIFVHFEARLYSSCNTGYNYKFYSDCFSLREFILRNFCLRN